MTSVRTKSEKLFNLLDTDKNGYLNISELSQLLEINGYKTSDHLDFFNEMDSSKDGKISLDEFIAVMENLPSAIHDEATIRKCFHDIDTDGSGFIDCSELNRFFKDLKEKISDDEVQRMITLFDWDRSGNLNYEEFIVWFYAKSL